MRVLIEIGVRILEAMFAAGLVVSGVAMVMGLIDDIGTFIIEAGAENLPPEPVIHIT